MEKLLSTREVAELLGVNEKLVYTLINEKGLPATRITGKWLFPRHLVEQWVESKTLNYPLSPGSAAEIPNLLLVAGSNDPLLDSALILFGHRHPEQVPYFGNLGSLGGLRALRHGLCHIATSHLAEEDGEDFNFSFAAREIDTMPAVVNFCRREQGLLVPRGNPARITGVADLGAEGLTIANRPLSASTRLSFDRELQRCGLDCRRLAGYQCEFPTHLAVGLEVLAGRADAAPAIRAVATLLELDFVPLHWERFDLLIPKSGYFVRGVQLFLELLHDPDFIRLAAGFSGYDLTLSGRILHPRAT